MDGQQRLTTLTILLCVLRELSADSDPKIATALDQRVWHADPLDDKPGRCHLKIGRRDEDFFRRNIQAGGSIGAFLELKTAEQTWVDSRKRLHENTARLFEKLADQQPGERVKIAKFIANRCYLVVVTTTNREAAYRIFSVLNDRGLPLSPTDILRAEILGELPKEDEDRYSRRWEEIEDDLGRDRFRDLFTHVRMIERKEKLRRTLHDDFKDHVLKNQTGDKFINDTLVPSWKDYRQILDGEVADSPDSDPSLPTYVTQRSIR